MLTMTDLFCGAGGSSSGAERVAGVRVRMAANHWRLAVETHNTNMPEADHDCADLSQVDPRRYPATDLLWASPECTNHSIGKHLPDSATPAERDAAERSRATMWDVVRFAEHHAYKAVIVENVVEAVKWRPFAAWLAAMAALGYSHSVLSANSAHVNQLGAPAPQLRDRLYVMFWRTGHPRPDVERYLAPRSVCAEHGEVLGVQTWKRPADPGQVQAGKYKRQYLYTCPVCARVVEPLIRPAAAIINWADLGTRIGDRAKPLADKTHARIAAGITTYGGQHLVVPVEGREGKVAASINAPLRTQTARAESALAFLPFFAELRGGGSKHRPVTQPIATVTASGNHHLLVTPAGLSGFVMRNNGSPGDGSEHNTPLHEPVRTLTTRGHQSLVALPGQHSVEDAYFRMLQPQEVSRGMAFADDYVLLGSKRDQVRMAGNAVTPNVPQHLLTAVSEALNGPAGAVSALPTPRGELALA